ncbi:MAG: UDP-glucose 4-epimerase, partial [Parcubacteria group bacterium GW2011_GWD2_40_9]
MTKNARKLIDGKKIMITGGTGSFGNATIETLLKLNPAQIVVFSRDEKKQFDMGNKYNDNRLKFVIGDVRDKDSIFHAMYGVDYVFHAAALKQVP